MIRLYMSSFMFERQYTVHVDIFGDYFKDKKNEIFIRIKNIPTMQSSFTDIYHPLLNDGPPTRLHTSLFNFVCPYSFYL